MTEVPEHLLRRSRLRRKALGMPPRGSMEPEPLVEPVLPPLPPPKSRTVVTPPPLPRLPVSDGFSDVKLGYRHFFVGFVAMLLLLIPVALGFAGVIWFFGFVFGRSLTYLLIVRWSYIASCLLVVASDSLVRLKVWYLARRKDIPYKAMLVARLIHKLDKESEFKYWSGDDILTQLQLRATTDEQNRLNPRRFR